MHWCETCNEPTEMDPVGDKAICPACGSRGPARRLPLLAVTGASGTGKTTLCPLVAQALSGRAAVFDIDWLIGPLGRASDGPLDWPAIRGAWLAVAHGVAQQGLSTVLFGPLVPDQIESLPERKWVGPIEFVLLDCDVEILRARIEQRPAWRSRDVEEQLEWARCLREHVSDQIRADRCGPEAAAREIASRFG